MSNFIYRLSLYSMTILALICLPTLQANALSKDPCAEKGGATIQIINRTNLLLYFSQEPSFNDGALSPAITPGESISYNGQPQWQALPTGTSTTKVQGIIYLTTQYPAGSEKPAQVGFKFTNVSDISCDVSDLNTLNGSKLNVDSSKPNPDSEYKLVYSVTPAQ